MSDLRIVGGKALNGTVEPIPNKNSIIKLIVAAGLTDETVKLHNVPKTTDVKILLKIWKQLGAKVSYGPQPGVVKINCSTVKSNKIPFELFSKIKATMLFIAPMLHRFGEVKIPFPGGCELGYRRIDEFFETLKDLGADIDVNDSGIYFRKGKMRNRKIWMTFPSVTATENLVLAMVLSKGEGEIYNAACEPHTQDLCHMLNDMGANIEGVGTNKLKISGVENLHGVEYTPINEHLDVGAYIAAAAMTGGEIRIKNAIPEHMGMILMMYERMGVKVKIEGTDILVPANQRMKVGKDIKGNLQFVEALPWPNFPTDLFPIAVVLGASSDGELFFFNKMDEQQLLFVEELAKMGMKTFIGGTQRIITYGPTKWQPSTINAPYIIQATMAMVLCALAAEGETIIKNAEALLRRYPDLVEKYQKLGAKIEWI